MARYNTQDTGTPPPEHRRIPRGSVRMNRMHVNSVMPSPVAEENNPESLDAVITPLRITPPPTPREPVQKVESAEEKNIESEDHSDALFFVRSVLSIAIEKGVSDVHFEPKSNSYMIRFRIDGVLQFHEERSITEYSQIVNSVKVLGDMDISERDVPQDGHIELSQENIEDDLETKTSTLVSRCYDIRVSFFPSVNGEVLVMRILNRENALLSTTQLGMDEESLKKLQKILLTSYGMILITGPTGSGKTTTLYSILGELRDDQKNIITLEDPIEFHLDWLRQCEIRERRGFTFEKAMESVLRQDPDVLMVGEIRDPKTAEHAVRSALVGRIVGSTIHANTTIGTIARLLELGISRSVVGHTLSGVIAQRLVRKNCDKCKEIYKPEAKALRHFELEDAQGPFFRGRGCEECDNSGYKGRTGIFSILYFDDEIRSLFFENHSLIDIQKRAIEKGMKTLKEDAREKILAGITTAEEAARAI